MKLPAELRNRTYELALLLQISGFTIRATHDRATSENAPLALTTTCRQIRAETESMFYSLNKLIMDIPAFPIMNLTETLVEASELVAHHMEPLRQWFTKLGATRLGLVEEVWLDLGISAQAWYERTFAPTWSVILEHVITPAREVLGTGKVRVKFEICFNDRHHAGRKVWLRYEFTFGDKEIAQQETDLATKEAARDTQIRELSDDTKYVAYLWHDEVAEAVLDHVRWWRKKPILQHMGT